MVAQAHTQSMSTTDKVTITLDRKVADELLLMVDNRLDTMRAWLESAVLAKDFDKATELATQSDRLRSIIRRQLAFGLGTTM